MERNLARLHQRGFTLMTSLAFTLVVGTVLAGVGTVVVSHSSRAFVESDYASAIQMADAGVNAEIARISSNTSDTSLADQIGSPRVGSIAGVPGTYSVFVRPWGTNCDGTGTWLAPSDMCIESTGTVNGIARTVHIRGRRKSIFDEYALFSYIQGNFSGGGASGGSTEIVGDLGSDGSVKFNGTMSSNIVNGTLFLDGTSAGSTPSTGSNIIKEPDPVVLPDVSEIATLQFPGTTGLSWLATNNSNANIKVLSSTDSSWAKELTATSATLADVQALPSAGFTSSSRTLGDPSNSTTSDTSTLDTNAGPRFYTAQDLTYQINAYGLNGQKVYIIPPGDYYFNNISLSQGNTGILLLTHLGQIRIWIDNPPAGKAKDDTIGVPIIFTDTTPSKFRLFYNKCANLTISGSGRFNGGFYAINSTCSNSTPQMKFTGNSMIYGSVITDYFTVSGGTKVVFPNNGGGSDPTDFSLWFGFKDNWKEMSANEDGNPVFVDGTNN